MEFSIKSGNPEKQRSGCVVVGVFESKKLSLPALLLDKASDGFIATLLRRGEMEGKSGTSLLLHAIPGINSERVLLVGLGKEKDFGDKEYCLAIKTAIKALKQTQAQDATLFLTELAVRKRNTAWKIRQTASICSDALYQFDQFKSPSPNPGRQLRKLALCIQNANERAQAEEALQQGLAIAEGMALCKDLGNMPPNVCNPVYLAQEAEKIAKEFSLECEILGPDEMRELGMHSLLAVAAGSHQPPRLICLHYKGGQPDEAPIVLVGKGVTFDTGGISLKPGAEMDEMKYDMCGAASVLGAMQAAARMALPINLSIVVPATENMPGGGATRPGDIVSSMSGQTIEILNTDAEGRLILCDALTYAGRFNPQVVIDVATLTGACVVALAGIASGLFANKDGLARELLEAGEEAGDRAWQLPLWDEYQELLKSPFADMANIGGRWGGAITAACFLSRFTKEYRWAHLDIAGTAWKSGADKGATGRPVPLLMHYLLQHAGKSLN